MVSSEDKDWADSCFADSSWDSLKDALLETLNTQNAPSPYLVDDSTEGPETGIFSEMDRDDVRNIVKTAIDSNTTATTSGAEQPKSNGGLNPENSDNFWSNHRVEDIFLPRYDEKSRELDPEVDFVFQSVELEQSKEDIFKIWDLEIPDEEDDGLIKQLNKALVESSIDPILSVSDVDDDYSKAWKELEKDESLDDLISGIADLSLSTNWE
ncbi:hypothetical protein CASFOL_036208 [Castilleja foliolosa]|uniref:Uncharacterized protein n=1 Tax=Castilleja foliolosa TaxID=1961234 RepID=A0ABD3BWG3_9LAMI